MERDCYQEIIEDPKSAIGFGWISSLRFVAAKKPSSKFTDCCRRLFNAWYVQHTQ